MKLKALTLLLALNLTYGYAIEQKPTPPAKPLPTLKSTKNIDTVLTEKAQAAIAKIDLLKGQAISAGSHDRVITLEGSVDNKKQEKAAIKAAASIPGVKKVRSHLTIKLMPTVNTNPAGENLR